MDGSGILPKRSSMGILFASLKISCCIKLLIILPSGLLFWNGLSLHLRKKKHPSFTKLQQHVRREILLLLSKKWTSILSCRLLHASYNKRVCEKIKTDVSQYPGEPFNYISNNAECHWRLFTVGWGCIPTLPQLTKHGNSQRSVILCVM